MNKAQWLFSLVILACAAGIVYRSCQDASAEVLRKENAALRLQMEVAVMELRVENQRLKNENAKLRRELDTMKGRTR